MLDSKRLTKSYGVDTSSIDLSLDGVESVLRKIPPSCVVMRAPESDPGIAPKFLKRMKRHAAT